MRFARSGTVTSGPRLLPAVLLALALIPSGSVAGPPAEGRSTRSVSIGKPMDGGLRDGEVLPRKGAGYAMLEETRRRRARFGVTELVQLVQRVAFRVSRKHGGSPLGVGDLSARRGGPIEHHGSHQNGRDVDMLFYILDRSGKSVPNQAFMPFDANGYSVEPPMEYRLDLQRNWALVEALLTSDRATVQWIFVADHIKTLLLEHAAASGASRSTVGRARQVLRQPGPKVHWDHYHVRIYCPPGDRPACTDVGPRWAWVR